MKFNIITCTYNRENGLIRLYNALRQLKINSHIEVVWWISDDGSTDNTLEYVKSWQNATKHNIKYLKSERNRGKHFALIETIEQIKEGYVIIIDSDDLPNQNILKSFAKYIDEYPGLSEYRARCTNQNGEYLGRIEWLESDIYLTSWHKLTLRKKFDGETISCFSLNYIKSVIKDFDRVIYLEDIRFINESIFWARNRKSKDMLFINKPLRVYYVNQSDSIQNKGNILRHYKEDVVYSKYFIQENFRYFFWRPKYFVSIIIKGMVARYIIEKNWIKSLTLYDTGFTKLVGWIFFPVAIIYYLKAKLTNSFWRS